MAFLVALYSYAPPPSQERDKSEKLLAATGFCVITSFFLAFAAYAIMSDNRFQRYRTKENKKRLWPRLMHGVIANGFVYGALVFTITGFFLISRAFTLLSKTVADVLTYLAVGVLGVILLHFITISRLSDEEADTRPAGSNNV